MTGPTHTPRWPDGPEIGLGVAEDAICLTYAIASGEVITESYGGLYGRLDAPAIRTRLLELKPSAALLFCRPDPEMGFESGVLLGTVVGMLAAMGIPILHPELPPTVQAPDGMVLH